MKTLIHDNHVGYKVRLFPTKNQEKIFYEYFGMSRFVYNLGIDIEEQQYQDYLEGKTDQRFLSNYSLRDKINNLKNNNEKYEWLKKFNVHALRGTIEDLIKAYDRYFNKKLHNQKPRYKNYNSKKQFSVRPERLRIEDKFVKLPSIGYVKYCNSYGEEIIGDGNKDKINSKYIHYSNSRISFDGEYYYLSFSIPKDQDHNIKSYEKYGGNIEWREQESSEAIGIDVGLKNDNWIVDSIGNRVERPNSNVLNKKISRLQRKYDRQKNTNLKKNSSFFEHHPNGSKNMQKTLAKINKYFKKITNRRKNVVHNYSNDLLKIKPKAIVMENISSKAMVIDNGNIFNKLIIDAALYESMQIIEKKMINNGIPVIYADSHYPSSQICSCCGYQQNIGRAKYYRCPECGNVIDRDLNAAINLANLA